MMGLALGRIGCLLNGCCYGGLCEHALGGDVSRAGSRPHVHQVEPAQTFSTA